MRLVRPLSAVILATGLGAWLTLADLTTSMNDNPDDARYLIVGFVGIALVVAAAGKHAIWLIPVATLAFAAVYERWLWTPPDEMPGGMDGIGWSPAGVIFVVPFLTAAVAVVLVLAATGRRAVARRPDRDAIG